MHSQKTVPNFYLNTLARNDWCLAMYTGYPNPLSVPTIADLSHRRVADNGDMSSWNSPVHLLCDGVAYKSVLLIQCRRDDYVARGSLLGFKSSLFDAQVRYHPSIAFILNDRLCLYSDLELGREAQVALKQSYNTMRDLNRGQSSVRVSYSPPSPQMCAPYRLFWNRRRREINEKKSKSKRNQSLHTSFCSVGCI